MSRTFRLDCLTVYGLTSARKHHQSPAGLRSHCSVVSCQPISRHLSHRLALLLSMSYWSSGSRNPIHLRLACRKPLRHSFSTIFENSSHPFAARRRQTFVSAISLVWAARSNKLTPVPLSGHCVGSWHFIDSYGSGAGGRECLPAGHVHTLLGVVMTPELVIVQRIRSLRA